MNYIITFILTILISSSLFGQNFIINDINDIKKYKTQQISEENEIEILINDNLKNSVKILLNNENIDVNQLSRLKQGGIWYYNLYLKENSIEYSKDKKSIPNECTIILTLNSESLSIKYKNNSVKKLPESEIKPHVGKDTKDNKTIITTKFKSIFSDSKILYENIKDSTLIAKTKKQNLLKSYNIHPDSISNYTFLKMYKEYLGKQQNSKVEAISSNIAKTDVTNIASGVARFLAERAKAELSENFFFYMHKQMDQYPDLKFYFPNSYNSLTELKNYNQNLDLEHLKNNFEQDIHRLPKNFYLTTQRTNLSPSSHLYTINNYFKNNPNGQWVDYSLQVVFENDGRINPKDLLYNFVHSDARKSFEEKLNTTNNQTSLNVLNSIKLAELVSNSLLSPNPERYWVSKDEINELLTNEELFQTYIGLLLAKSDFKEYKIQFGKESLRNITEENYNKFLGYKAVVNFASKNSDIKNAIKKLDENYNLDQLKGLNILLETISNSKDLKELLTKKIELITTKKELKENDVKLKKLINAEENEIVLDKKEYSEYSNFYNQLKSLIKNIYNSYEEVDNAANILKGDKNNLSTESLYKMYDILNQNITTITTQVDDLNLFNQKISFNDASFKNYVKPSIDIAYNMSAKKYNVAIKNFITIINSASEKQDIQNFENIFENEQLTKTLMVKYYSKTDNIKELIKDFEIKNPKSIYIEKESQILISNVINERYNQICEDNKNNKKFHKHIKEHHKEYDTFLSKFNTYGTLIANVALAQNSTEVKDAISASVLPVGSSRVKRNSNWSITMNAFVGGFAGKAYYKEFVDDVAVKKSITSFGIIAPIGISINKGNLKMFNSNTALGLTLQVIDLGSLVNFYVQKGDGAELPNNSKIELGDIIAPGAMLTYSLGDSPFTILGGVQYVPNLSRMESIPTNKDFKPLTWRMHFGIAIDIPLFNLKVWN